MYIGPLASTHGIGWDGLGMAIPGMVQTGGAPKLVPRGTRSARYRFRNHPKPEVVFSNQVFSGGCKYVLADPKTEKGMF